MADFALNDRGSLQVVTENFYDAEILRVLGPLSIGTVESYDGPARLVPEPDNPYDPRTISVRIRGERVGHLGRPDAERYWSAITRIVASGYEPVASAHLRASLVVEDDFTEVDAELRLDLSAPDLLFPLNQAPQRATVLPRGSSIKVLEEQEHAEYLHLILPRTGEGRLMLTLEVNQIRTPTGEHVDIVEVLHQRQVVGRLSTQLSEQFIPVIRHAFDHEMLTAAWGTIRGTSYEVSLTVQAARPDTIPQQWYDELPREFLPLEPEAESYRIPDAYVPAESERARPARRRRRPAGSSPAGHHEHHHHQDERAERGSGHGAAHGRGTAPGHDERAAASLGDGRTAGSGATGSSAVGARTIGSRLAGLRAAGSRAAARRPVGSQNSNRAPARPPVARSSTDRTSMQRSGADRPRAAVERDPGGPDRTFLGLLVITALLVILGLVFAALEPLITALCLIAAVATGFMAFYLHSVMRTPEVSAPEHDAGEHETGDAGEHEAHIIDEVPSVHTGPHNAIPGGVPGVSARPGGPRPSAANEA